MKTRSKKNSKLIAEWLLVLLEWEGLLGICFMKFSGHYWFHADELYKQLNGNRICENIPDNHVMYMLNEDEYFVNDNERQPHVYVSEMGALKMLHNVISPVTIEIFKTVGLDRIKSMIDQNKFIA